MSKIRGEWLQAGSAAQQCHQAHRLLYPSFYHLLLLLHGHQMETTALSITSSLCHRAPSAYMLEGREGGASREWELFFYLGEKLSQKSSDRLCLISQVTCLTLDQSVAKGIALLNSSQPWFVWLLFKRRKREWVLGRQPGVSAELHQSLLESGNQLYCPVTPPRANFSSRVVFWQFLSFHSWFLKITSLRRSLKCMDLAQNSRAFSESCPFPALALGCFTL